MTKNDTPGIRLGGVTIRRITGHNAFFITNGFRSKESGKPVRPIGPGAVIRITRSGDVIPHVIEVVKGAAKPQMPKEAYTWNKSGVDIIQSEASSLSDKKRVVYFFTKLDVEGLKMGTVSKFYDQGLDSILKIVKAPKSKFLEIEGIQERTAQKLRTNIDEALAKMTLPALMDASGCFGALGEKRLILIVKKYPDVVTDEVNAKTLHDQVLGIAGFKDTLAAQFVTGLPKFRFFYAKLGVKAQAPVKIKIATNGSMKGQIVVFTGFRDPILEAEIQKQGGEIGSGVSAKTTLLVVKDPSSGSSKITKAKQLGITITTGIALRAKLKV